MLKRLRRKMLAHQNWVARIPHRFLIRSTEDPYTFTSYSIKQQGWVWKVFPRFVLVEHGSAALMNPTKVIADQVADDMRTRVERAAGLVAATHADYANARIYRATARVADRAPSVLVGTMEWPTAVAKAATTMTSRLQQAVVKAASDACVELMRNYIAQHAPRILRLAEQASVSGGSTGLSHALPQNTKFVFTKGSKDVYFIEEAPRVRSIVWDGERVQVSFPYVVFAVVLDHGGYHLTYAFFRNTPLSTSADKLYWPSLPDIYAEGHVCYNGTRVRGTPSEVIADALTVFWNASFVTRHAGEYLARANSQVPGFSTAKWFKMSTRTPAEVLKYEWIDSGYTVQNLQAKIFGNPHESGALDLFRREVEQVTGDLGLTARQTVHNALAGIPEVAAAREQMFTALQNATMATYSRETLEQIITEVLNDVCDPEKLKLMSEAEIQQATTSIADQVPDFSQALAAAMLSQLNQILDPQGRNP